MKVLERLELVDRIGRELQSRMSYADIDVYLKAYGRADGGPLSTKDRFRIAKQKGYEGDPCPNCQQMTLVRSGACAKCDTCGETSGCS